MLDISKTCSVHLTVLFNFKLTTIIFMQYRRDYTAGATYFFTVVMFRRLSLLGSRQRKGEQAIWQRRFWEHRIRTECDFNNHIDYIHYNPVKHGLVMRPVDWQYSSIHRYIQQGILTPDWGVSCIVNIPDATGYE